MNHSFHSILKDELSSLLLIQCKTAEHASNIVPTVEIRIIILLQLLVKHTHTQTSTPFIWLVTMESRCFDLSIRYTRSPCVYQPILYHVWMTMMVFYVECMGFFVAVEWVNIIILYTIINCELPKKLEWNVNEIRRVLNGCKWKWPNGTHDDDDDDDLGINFTKQLLSLAQSVSCIPFPFKSIPLHSFVSLFFYLYDICCCRYFFLYDCCIWCCHLPPFKMHLFMLL